TTVKSQPVPIDLAGSGSDQIFVNNNNRTFGFNPNGTGYNNTPDGLIINNFGKFAPSSFGNRLFVVNESSVAFYDNTITQTQQYQTGRIVTAPPTQLNSPDRAIVGFNTGSVIQYTESDSVVTNPS